MEGVNYGVSGALHNHDLSGSVERFCTMNLHTSGVQGSALLTCS